MRITRMRAVAAALGIAAATALTACGSSGGGSHANSSLTIYSQWLKGQPGQVFMQSVADDFTKATGIKVNMVWKGNSVSSSLVPSLNTGSPPADMVETSNSQIQSALYPTGGLLDLSSLYNQKAYGSDKTIGELVGEGAKVSSTVVDDTGKSTGVVVTVPYWASSYGVFWFNGATNPDLVGNTPKTWDDMVALMGKLKAAGKAPLAEDGSVASYNYQFYANLVRSIVGQDALTKAFADHTGAIWDQPGYLRAAELVADIPKNGFMLAGYNSSKYPEEENKWANNKAVFNLNGSWLQGEVAKVAAPGFQFQSFLFPPVAGGNQPGLNWQTSGLAILKASKNIQAAEKFAGFLLQEKYQERVATDMGMLPVAPNVKVPAALQPVKDAIDSGKDLLPNTSAAYAGWEVKVPQPLASKLLLGTISPKDFISAVKSQTVDYWKTHS